MTSRLAGMVGVVRWNGFMADRFLASLGMTRLNLNADIFLASLGMTRMAEKTARRGAQVNGNSIFQWRRAAIILAIPTVIPAKAGICRHRKF